jgi:hypothetical protein
MYEYNKTRGGLGYPLPTRVGRANLPPAMGWTGGFTIPGNEQRFSSRTCSGSAVMPMDPSSDLICGRSAEVSYLNSIGCVPVGFQGSHHCLSDDNNEGIFYCCPPGVLDRELARAGGTPRTQPATASVIPSGALLGVGLLLAIAMGWGLYNSWTEKPVEDSWYDRPDWYKRSNWGD